MTDRRALVLIICDGWGHSDETYGNAIAAARTPNVDRFRREWPSTLLAASGNAVGLPRGQQGNSEVGHLTIGSGRILLQDLTRISQAVEDGSFFDNRVLCAAVDRAIANNRTVHCMGLLSPGGVHSEQSHAVALATLAHGRGAARIVFHLFTDGRDVAPQSCAGYLAQFRADISDGLGTIGSISGRYYAMDRDHRWERTQRAYDTLVGTGHTATEDALAYILDSYRRGVTDEFIEPAAVLTKKKQFPIEDGDTVICFNFRPDRARQLSHALCDEHFDGFSRSRVLRDLAFVGFTQYDSELAVPIAFPKQDASATLAEIVSNAGLRQYHVAETEKYAHVTYFINGGREEAFPGEERLLVPSPDVATYDVMPEMSAAAITDAVVRRIDVQTDSLIVVNFANPDMIGHTGNFPATVQAVEFVDACLGRIVNAALRNDSSVMITADHGNAEQMVDVVDGSPLTAHTTSPVALFVCGGTIAALADGGGLVDVAALALQRMGLPAPAAMTGRHFLTDANSGR